MKIKQWRYADFSGRYIHPEEYHSQLKELDIAVEEIGSSFEGRPIRLYKTGKGAKKVLVWTQMHGNEPTGTLSMLDILTNYSHELATLNEITLYFLPILNPDGATQFTRRNAQLLDINRDARDLETEEGKVLMQAIEILKPQLCLNLHDQRTCFAAGEGNAPAVFAVLAPSAGEIKHTNDARKIAIGLLNAALEELLPNENISRFTDEYYPTAFGDLLQARGYCNILLEAGARYPDKNRDESRAIMGKCILSILKNLNENRVLESNEYKNLPLNKESLEDVILRNVTWSSDGKSWKGQMALRRTEKLEGGKLSYGIKLVDQGDLAHKHCHVQVQEAIVLHEVFELESDLTDRIFRSNGDVRNFSEFI
jgi:hypothetical protein